MKLDSVEARWARLAPYAKAAGPADARPRPAVLTFHGCGGPREQGTAYATMARELGMRTFSIDSFSPRGWGRGYAQTFVCTGARFRGAERAGDVLAACWGVARRADVDASRLLLMGWSHGSWAIMDLMTMPLTARGEAGLADPTPEPLAGVRSLFLLYPWSGPTALSRTRPWVRAPAVHGVVATRDHLATVGMSRAVYGGARRAGAALELWEPANSTHAFDQPGQSNPVMRYDAALGAESVRRFGAFARRTLLD